MGEEPTLDIRDNREERRLEAHAEGQMAVVEYNLIKDGIIIAHTEVPKALEGRGVASRLFREVLELARREGRKIVPVCPVFALYVKRHPESHELLDPSFRRPVGLTPVIVAHE